jgi:murein DD-endopeptidase MepM/ murein hydrolase activator NlpD
MPTASQIAKRALFVTYLVVIHVALLFFAFDWLWRNYGSTAPVPTAALADPTQTQAIPTPLPVPENFASDGMPSPENQPPNIGSVPALIIPVVGVKPDQLTDNFSDSRSEDRFHDAIDIPAPAGTPVIAAADGEIARFWESERGGITIYQITADRKFVLYYAHLQRRADGLTVGMTVKKGATIGYVGDTGNAGAGNYHLHFSIAQITDPKRFWEGTYLNPYPLLRSGTYPQIP